MSFIESNLLPNEEIAYRTKLHWFIFVPSSIAIAIGLSLIATGYAQSPSNHIFIFSGLAFIAYGTLLFIVRWIDLKTSEFGVTNKRVLIKIGFIRRHSLEIILNKIEGIGVNQGIIGRIFGFGTITVSGTGGSKEHFAQIDDPLEFRRQVQSRIES
ncbi:PH domain-containing protein [Magnetospirillum molischianum]|uniref:Putative Permease of the major facilitator superfamily n=1 Tax=Magnetospirillum molischianum DSM 120 TaxID=1150626 RepID=H8FU67_MAGML|nr:PH domain-containing protein [Magnetospirillum molischianum]CCG41905.1 putative Permease of the major facilitator superfamily [Magnetospirillum molischianum DSM 120]